MFLQLLVVVLVVLSSSVEGISKKKAPPYKYSTLLNETVETWEIASLLKIYDTFDGEGYISLRRIGKPHDGGYLIPVRAMEKSDLVLGYGVSNDISFEEDASRIYGKPSYGFDCTCSVVKPKHPLCHFVPECIGCERETQLDRFTTFEDELTSLSAWGKKFFLKMDIEGNEYEVFPDILRHASDLTGIVLEIHFNEDGQIKRALQLLRDLSRDFLLVHVHGNNCCGDVFVTGNSTGYIPRVLELTYINKNLVDRYSVSLNQYHPTRDDMANWQGVSDPVFSIGS